MSVICSLTGDDVWAYAALEQLLGSGPSLKWASNLTSNRINSALVSKTQEPFHVSLYTQATYSVSV